MTELADSLAGLPFYASYFGIALLLLTLALAAYGAVTPYRDLRRAGEGNLAAAACLAGVVLGFALPLARVIAQSASLLDLLLWAGVALGVQLVAFVALRTMASTLNRNVAAGQLASGLLLAAVAVALGLINAASIG
jgi:putative membrane protein